MDGRLAEHFKGRKTFSHRRNNFPRTSLAVGTAVEEWSSEFETGKLIPLGVTDPHGTGAEIAG